MDTLLVDYDKRVIYVCWGCTTDDRHIEEMKTIWKGWEINRQDIGLPFHFTYTNRDPAIIEMTDQDFEKYKSDLFNFNPDKEE